MDDSDASQALHQLSDYLYSYYGKTMIMSMVESFFSVDYADRGDLFQGLSIWEDEK